jgi:hypothetical protein
VSATESLRFGWLVVRRVISIVYAHSLSKVWHHCHVRTTSGTVTVHTNSTTFKVAKLQ